MTTGAGDSAPVLTAPLAPRRTEAQVRRAVAAVYVVFIVNGFGFASWASRIPQVRDLLAVTPGTLGLVLLCAAVGSLIAMPLSSVVIARLGERRTVTLFALVYAVGLATIAVGVLSGIGLVSLGIFLLGFGNGMWDVAMNVQGAAAEQALSRVIMSRFHAGFSIGTVLGAGIGAAMVALNVPVTAHLLAITGVVAVVIPIASRGFLPHSRPIRTGQSSSKRALVAWTEPRTLLIGLLILCMAFTEGTGNDWLNIAVIDGYRAAPALGTITFALFLAAMTLGRWFGPGIIERHGRVLVLRVSAIAAIAGLLLVVFGRLLPLAMIGSGLWGLGTALGFPTGISAASDDPGRAAARVSVAASIGYLAFLAGPPLIGFVGDHVGVLRGLSVTLGVLAVALLASGATAPLRTDTARAPGPEQ